MTDFDQFTGTRPVAPQHAFDIARLEQWMQENVDGFRGPLEVEQFKGGQSNPTFRLSAASGRYVMRRKPPGKLLPSAHAVDREFRVISALANTDVPVARPHALCEDLSVIGTMFYVMDCVEGRVIWDPALPGMDPAARAAHYDELNRVQAALHSIDPGAVGLGDYGRTGNYLERQVGRWTKQYRASETEPIEAFERLIEWLPAHMPTSDETRIVHGDYRFNNVIFHPSEPRILAVLDWELSTLGHPLVDFAYSCLKWHARPPALDRSLTGADLAALGIPSEHDYLVRYLARTGRSPDAVSDSDWRYYIVFNMFRLGAILQGIAARAAQGNASNAAALETGRRARPMAEQAWAMVEGASGG
ncbi:MAG: phosphotransferase [Burkholderiaceae bacterium]